MSHDKHALLNRASIETMQEGYADVNFVMNSIRATVLTDDTTSLHVPMLNRYGFYYRAWCIMNTLDDVSQIIDNSMGSEFIQRFCIVLSWQIRRESLDTTIGISRKRLREVMEALEAHKYADTLFVSLFVRKLRVMLLTRG